MASISSTTSLGPVFQAGGLASGLDTNSIINQLVALESQPLTALQAQQTALQTQISSLGDIASKLSALGDAAADLGTNGVLAAKTASSNTSFTAVPGTNAAAGSYNVQVLQLAQASKWLSQPFAPGTGHPGGTLQLTVQGQTYAPITITDGMSLADVASAIQAQGAPVSAVVLNDGTNNYLSITATDTGLPSGGGAALNVAFTPTVAPAPGTPPVYSETQAAQDASVSVDGLTFTRSSNTVSDVIPGTTLTLTQAGGPAENLVLATDVDGTQARLQKFVDAYNSVIQLVNTQLSPTQSTDRSSSLAGDGAIRTLQAKLQDLTTTIVGGATVRSLADLGVKTASDGTLSIDPTTLASAVSRAPSAVNAIFSTAGTGLSAAVQSLVDLETPVGTGVLSMEQTQLGNSVQDLSNQADELQQRIDAYRQTLSQEFTAMEGTVSGLKSIGNFLAAQSSGKTS